MSVFEERLCGCMSAWTLPRLLPPWSPLRVRSRGWLPAEFARFDGSSTPTRHSPVCNTAGPTEWGPSGSRTVYRHQPVRAVEFRTPTPRRRDDPPCTCVTCARSSYRRATRVPPIGCDRDRQIDDSRAIVADKKKKIWQMYFSSLSACSCDFSSPTPSSRSSPAARSYHVSYRQKSAVCIFLRR